MRMLNKILLIVFLVSFFCENCDGMKHVSPEKAKENNNKKVEKLKKKAEAEWRAANKRINRALKKRLETADKEDEKEIEEAKSYKQKQDDLIEKIKKINPNMNKVYDIIYWLGRGDLQKRKKMQIKEQGLDGFFVKKDESRVKNAVMLDDFITKNKLSSLKVTPKCVYDGLVFGKKIVGSTPREYTFKEVQELTKMVETSGFVDWYGGANLSMLPGDPIKKRIEKYKNKKLIPSLNIMREKSTGKLVFFDTGNESFFDEKKGQFTKIEVFSILKKFLEYFILSEKSKQWLNEHEEEVKNDTSTKTSFAFLNN